MKASNPFSESDGLRVVVYAGDNKILIAMSLGDDRVNEANKNLAGFAIWRTVAGKEVCLGNRITFEGAIKPGEKLTDTKWTDSGQGTVSEISLGGRSARWLRQGNQIPREGAVL